MSHLEPESMWMKVARKLGSERTAWALRRLHCPVGPEALVLEVGSGGNPYARANVLLDAYENTRERHWVPLKADRPTVLGFVEHLPFKDQAFDFVIASHVLEHSPDPSRFLAELQRVAKAGYIEVPDALMERLNPYKDHRLEITQRAGKLVVRKKPAWRADEELVELYEDRVKRVLTRELIPQRPFSFHLRYYWEGSIDFVVLNPKVDASWEAEATSSVTGQAKPGLRGQIHTAVLDQARAMLSQTARNRTIDLRQLVACPACPGSGALTWGQEVVQCSSCQATYPIRNGIPVMYPPQS